MKLMTVDLTADNGTDYASWTTTGAISPAESVDRLIRVLAETRKSLEPTVPKALPLIIKQPPQVHSPAWQWSMEADGSLVLNLRHPGLGWLGFRLPDAEGFHTNLVDVILQRDALRTELRPSED
ncbi:hypothetical protein VLK31_28135 [Variovorax sp. H27-G14]|uniref:hypothetical protein n=1 Tax=Variovorax sp. H27-G14 TaxID=3111914 RepID=UPI0038FC3F13